MIRIILQVISLLLSFVYVSLRPCAFAGIKIKQEDEDYEPVVRRSSRKSTLESSSVQSAALKAKTPMKKEKEVSIWSAQHDQNIT